MELELYGSLKASRGSMKNLNRGYKSLWSKSSIDLQSYACAKAAIAAVNKPTSNGKGFIDLFDANLALDAQNLVIVRLASQFIAVLSLQSKRRCTFGIKGSFFLPET